MDGEKKKLIDEVERLRALIPDMAKTLAEYDHRLADYWYAKGRQDAVTELAKELEQVRVERAKVKSILAGFKLELKRRKTALTQLKRDEVRHVQN